MCRTATATFMSACSDGNRREELLGLVSADAATASWTLDCSVDIGGAVPDVTGPYIQGRPGDRFIYLSWVTVDDANSATLFRRAKLWLDHDCAGRGATPGTLYDKATHGVSDEHGLRTKLIGVPREHRPCRRRSTTAQRLGQGALAVTAQTKGNSTKLCAGEIIQEILIPTPRGVEPP